MKLKKFYHNAITLVTLTSIFLLTACNEEKIKEKKTTTETLIIKAKNKERQLFYNGLLYPLNSISVLSPYDGNIKSVHFNYGTDIKKDQLLFLITSEQMREQYRTAINEYFKAKDNYSTGKATQEGNEVLFKNGLTPENDYRSSLSTFHNEQLSYYQAKAALDEVLHQVNINPKKINNLSLANTNQINELLGKRFDKINVYSPANGIALFPLNDNQSTTDHNDNRKLQPGAEIKRGQLLLSIGKLDGLRSNIIINEVNINEIKVGEETIISSPAFPGIKLHGIVDGVGAQANTSGGDSNQSVFNVAIKIPNVPKEARKSIRIGMSAKIAIKIPYNNQIFIPIKAIITKNGQSYVMRLNDNKQVERTPVVTGYTTQSEVQILSGLKIGDTIQYSLTD